MIKDGRRGTAGVCFESGNIEDGAADLCFEIGNIEDVAILKLPNVGPQTVFFFNPYGVAVQCHPKRRDLRLL
jgi:hypothetical protein